MSNQSSKKRQFQNALGLLLLVIFLPLIILALPVYFLAGVFLHIAIWICWCGRSRNVLFVYSESPVWHDYIENYILPRLGNRTVILNWSQRGHWKPTLAVLAFRYFGGSRDFNPMAVVFRPFRLARKFRFYKSFHELKHGRPDAVKKMENELYDLVEKITGKRAT